MLRSAICPWLPWGDPAVDPWGRPLVGEGLGVYSLGPNGLDEGGRGDDVGLVHADQNIKGGARTRLPVGFLVVYCGDLILFAVAIYLAWWLLCHLGRGRAASRRGEALRLLALGLPPALWCWLAVAWCPLPFERLEVGAPHLLSQRSALALTLGAASALVACALRLHARASAQRPPQASATNRATCRETL
ncbi:MAG: hypothetical protein R3F62_13940 [Planctomycetota bacterium]